MPLDILHTFLCKNCHTIATSPVYIEGERHVCCNLCNGYMRRVWSERITNEKQRARAERGLVFGPYVEDETMPGDGNGRR